jgi:hypothetical protein
MRKIINLYFCFFRQDQQDLHDLFLSFQMKLRKTNPPLAEMIRRLCANTCPVEFCPADSYQGIPLWSILSELEGAITTKQKAFPRRGIVCFAFLPERQKYPDDLVNPV